MTSGFQLKTALLSLGLLLLAGSVPALADDDHYIREQILGMNPTKETPVQQLEIYLDAFHYEAGHLERQMEAHHFCKMLNPEMVQCAVYEGNSPESKLIGVEYVISEHLYQGLTASEKKMWHSHKYEVTSGQLIAPKLSETDEYALMKTIYGTYGKAWNTWSPMDNKLPIGHPKLMQAFTKDGQVEPSLLNRRDQAFGISTTNKRQKRQDIPTSGK